MKLKELIDHGIDLECCRFWHLTEGVREEILTRLNYNSEVKNRSENCSMLVTPTPHRRNLRVAAVRAALGWGKTQVSAVAGFNSRHIHLTPTEGTSHEDGKAISQSEDAKLV